MAEHDHDQIFADGSSPKPRPGTDPAEPGPSPKPVREPAPASVAEPQSRREQQASDFVNISPGVSGRIVGLNIVDNQTVKRGDLLATIDPTPFQLALDEKRAKKTEAEAQLAVDRDVIAAAQAQLGDAAAKERLASDTVRPARPITAAGFYSSQGLNTLTAKEQEAKAASADAESSIAKAQQTLTLHQATVATITTEIAYLQ